MRCKALVSRDMNTKFRTVACVVYNPGKGRITLRCAAVHQQIVLIKQGNFHRITCARQAKRQFGRF